MKKTKIIASIVALTCTMGVLSAKPKADSSSGKSMSGKIKVLSAMDSEAAEMTDKYFIYYKYNDLYAITAAIVFPSISSPLFIISTTESTSYLSMLKNSSASCFASVFFRFLAR